MKSDMAYSGNKNAAGSIPFVRRFLLVRLPTMLTLAVAILAAAFYGMRRKLVGAVLPASSGSTGCAANQTPRIFLEVER